ncbi:transcriptional regulator GcvA [Duganella sp. P38]|uniref:transcriptional regulator GcvA n=1 Tax=Duganella sp. P38 TaxID=3423949 RepID=UPI003D7B0E86
MPPLPPFTALRAFASAARHLSISRAADELHLTHGAVSHQIKNLEQQLAVRLIARKGRGIVLTPAGAAFAVKLNAALAQLEDVVAEVRADAMHGPLRISALPSFAARWLLPRLPDFRARHPHIDLHLHTTTELADFGRDGLDLAIRYGRGAWPGTAAEKLMDEELIPVCSPRFNGGRLPAGPEDMRDMPLLRDTHVQWASWFAAMGLTLPEPKNTFVYTDSGLLVQAAVAGQGVALARAVLAGDDLAAGHLVRLPGAALPAGSAYYIVHPAQPPLSANGRAFVAWLRQRTSDA